MSDVPPSPSPPPTSKTPGPIASVSAATLAPPTQPPAQESSRHTPPERFAAAASSPPDASPCRSAQTASPPRSQSPQLRLPCAPVPPAPHHPLFALPLPRPTKSQAEQSAQSTHTNATGLKTSNPESAPPAHHPASRQQCTQHQHSPKPIRPHQRMHRSTPRQPRTTQRQPSPSIGSTVFLHLKRRQQKPQRAHQCQQHTRSRQTPRRHIRIHQHQRAS